MTTQGVPGIRAVPFVDLGGQHREIKAEILEAIDRVLSHGQFILGEEVAAFEAEFAAYCGTKYAVGVGNGTDALVLAMRAMGIGPGDEVITAPNSFLASASSIALTGATPVFADVRDDLNIDPERVEAAVTSRTKAIMPVHLTGRPADMTPIMDVADRHGLAVVEDAAQAVNASYKGQTVGSFGVAGCFSFHPLKNLNALGDGGAITTDDEAVYEHLVSARNHGLVSRDETAFWSVNSRLDALQAAVLRVKMRYLEGGIAARRRNAELYRERLTGVVECPRELPHEFAVYQTFVVQAERRDELQRFLAERGVETKVHYPVPIHLQEAAKDLGYRAGDFPVTERQARRILSLPNRPELTDDDVAHVAYSIRSFYAS